MSFPEYVPTDTTDDGAIEYLFTSVEEIQRMLSLAGERRHTDDVDPDSINYDYENDSDVNRDNVLAELIQRATSHIMSRLGPRYLAADIYRVPRIREIATYWAIYKLTKRRGNNPLYEEDYIESEATLDDFRTGAQFLDAPSNGQRAYMQSYIIDNRYSARVAG